MPIELDHIVLAVNDRSRSIDFYTRILGLEHEGEDGSFSKLRVTPGFSILLAPWRTDGGEHMAFARIVDAEIPYGDRFDGVGTMTGPGDESGSRGMGKAVYFFDPGKHLIEIRHYEIPER
jgi:glyoxylase I family protein